MLRGAPALIAWRMGVDVCILTVTVKSNPTLAVDLLIRTRGQPKPETSVAVSAPLRVAPLSCAPNNGGG